LIRVIGGTTMVPLTMMSASRSNASPHTELPREQS
jgi:hypothetical protein